MKSLKLISFLILLPFVANTQINDTVHIDICIGDSYEGYTETGTYIDTFKLNNGQDSIRTLKLIVEQDFICLPFKTMRKN